MVDRACGRLSIARQCRLLGLSRSGFYYEPCGESPENLVLMRRIDVLFLECPFYGSRQMARALWRDGLCIGRHRVRRLMRLMGLRTVYQNPRTSDPHPDHKIYPYLLRGLAIMRANHVWCADITYRNGKISLESLRMVNGAVIVQTPSLKLLIIRLILALKVGLVAVG